MTAGAGLPSVQEWTSELGAEFEQLAGEVRAALRKYPGSQLRPLADYLGLLDRAQDVSLVLKAVGIERERRWYLGPESRAAR